MMTMPIYDMMMLPDITFYFKRDIFEKMGYEEVSAGEDILFIMLKSDKEQESLSEDDFYPVGISGKIEAVDEGGKAEGRVCAPYPVTWGFPGRISTRFWRRIPEKSGAN